jgi:hypothetical protein
VPSSRGELLSDEAEVMGAHGEAVSVEVDVMRECVEGRGEEAQSMSERPQCLSEEGEVLGANSHDGDVRPAVIGLEALDPSAIYCTVSI